MKINNKPQMPKPGKSGGLARFLKTLANKITNLFKPEEVEVTFKNDGKSMRYTYKVIHKQLA